MTNPRTLRDPARLATGIKMFLILVLALLPLGMIALIATLQSTRTADVERRALLRVAATESARALSIELIGDMGALRTAANVLAADPGNAESCNRVRSILAVQTSRDARFSIGHRGQTALCGERFAPGFPGEAGASGEIVSRIVPNQGLLLAVRSDDRSVVAKAYFPLGLLASVGRPTGMMPGYRLSVVSSEARLALRDTAQFGPLAREEHISVPLGIGDLNAEMSLSRVPLTAPEIVALIAPLLMWFAAAAIAWLVTDRLLLAPLKRLRHELVAYRPGESFTPPPDSRTPAIELQELGETFRRITTIVADHEADLARGLEHQTRLTREVHHRVKNNLQVISSLINLHARGAKGAEAVRAYASIQRRVDALSVVHRNYFAEQEVNRGLNLRSVLGELASNIRATAPEGSARMQIMLELESLYVTQDTAVAVSFLVTELIELAMQVDPAAVLTITLTSLDLPGRAELAVRSPALQTSNRLTKHMAGSVTRVIEGLGRQLRSPLAQDPGRGRFAVEISYVARD